MYALKRQNQCTVCIEIRKTAEALSLTFNTVSSAIKRLTDAEMIVQATNASQNCTFAYEDYLSIIYKGI